LMCDFGASPVSGRLETNLKVGRVERKVGRVKLNGYAPTSTVCTSSRNSHS